MDEKTGKKSINKNSVLWHVFRSEAEGMNLPARVAERIKLRIREALRKRR